MVVTHTIPTARTHILPGQALQAEIVVTFEGSTEFGNPFMARQSYLPDEVYWGYTFVNIVIKPEPGDSRYKVDLRRCEGCC